MSSTSLVSMVFKSPRTFLQGVAQLIVVSLSLATPFASASKAATLLPDIGELKGLRTSQLVGYGVVVGLRGTGDNPKNAPFTVQFCKSAAQRARQYEINCSGASLRARAVAAVMVTSELSPTATGPIEVNLSAMGDAKSLAGGALISTSLLGADGEIYGVGAGPVRSLRPGNSATGRANGLITRAIYAEISTMPPLHLVLHSPDLSMALTAADAINARFPGVARLDSPAAVLIHPPTSEPLMRFIADIEHIALGPHAAWAPVGDLPMYTVTALGLVVGLKAGDGDTGNSDFLLAAYKHNLRGPNVEAYPPAIRPTITKLWNKTVATAESEVAAQKVAFVFVTGHFYPFSSWPVFDLRVGPVFGAKTVVGGELLGVELLGPDGKINASAGGRVEATSSGEEREGLVRGGLFKQPPIFDVDKMAPVHLASPGPERRLRSGQRDQRQISRRGDMR